MPGHSTKHARPWTRRSLVSTLIAVPTLVVVTACAGGAPAAPSQPTVQAVTTQVVAAASPAAATAQAAASPAAATVQAAASPAMATAQAAASPMATAGAGVVATAAAGLAPMASPSPMASPAAQAGGLRIADASMADSTPWLMLQNPGNDPVEVGGWMLHVGAATAEIPTNAVVEPGGTLTLHAGTGLSSEDELYLGNAGDALAAAALPGTPVRLTDAGGRIQAETTVPRF